MLPNQVASAVPQSECPCLWIPYQRPSTTCTAPLHSSLPSVSTLAHWPTPGLNSSSMQAILKRLFPLPASLFSFMFSLPFVWKLSPSVREESLNFILKNKWDFIKQLKVGGGESYSRSAVRKSEADLQTSLWSAELFLPWELVSSVAACCPWNEVQTPCKACTLCPLLTFPASSLATWLSKCVPKLCSLYQSLVLRSQEKCFLFINFHRNLTIIFSNFEIIM